MLAYSLAAIVLLLAVCAFTAAPQRPIVIARTSIFMAVRWLGGRLLKLFGVNGHAAENPELARAEIRSSIAQHHQEGNFEREHRYMLGGILDLRDLQVGDVMRHRTSIESVDADLPKRDLVDAVIESNHSRVPLWRDEPENIIGILSAKLLAQQLVEKRGKLDEIDIADLATPPWFVPDTTTLEEQLAAFREHRARFALVVDEYGTLQGLVTLEDILEEVFGDISDRRPHETRREIRRRPDGSYLVDGKVAIRDLNRELDWRLPEEDAVTVAGLVIAQSGTIPDAGQRFAFFGYTFEIMRRQRNRITALRIVPPRMGMAPGVAPLN
jgi:Mg2+/Co2+ transporter CorB